jgi:hypothetical protein
MIQLKFNKLFQFTVSVGGILGLFMGASILSLVEIIYFFTIRTCQQSNRALEQANN